MLDSIEVPDEMKALYIERRRLDMIECIKAFELSNFSFLQKVGHQVSGNAQSFGFEALTPIANDLENAAKEKDAKRLVVILKDFAQAIQTLSF